MFENFKTVLLLGSLTGILIVIGGIIGSIFHLASLGIIIGFVLAVGMNFISYFYSDSITLSAYNAKIVTPEEAPVLHEIVIELANNAGIKKPKVAIIPSYEPNAFATGRNEDHAVVAATSGILNLLTHDEIKGVLAHEIGHIKNRDILISSVAATVAGMITMVADLGRYAVFFADDEDGGGAIASILVAIIAPIAASIIQLAISRSREYKADATGAMITSNPLALADALRKIESGIIDQPMDAKPTDAHMFIINPFEGAGQKLLNLFSTHPSTEDRIKRLEKMSVTGEYDI